MLRYLYILFFLLLTGIINLSHAQNKTIDSLLSLLKKDSKDTSKVIHLNKLSQEYQKLGSNDTALQYNNYAFQLAQKLNFQRGIASSYNGFGIIYEVKGNLDIALKNYFASLKIREALLEQAERNKNFNEIKKSKQAIADSYNNITNIYTKQGNFDNGLENYNISLKIYQEINDKQGIALSYSNIAVIYWNKGNLLVQKNDSAMAKQDYNMALKNYYLALKNFKEIGNKEGIAGIYNNISAIYIFQKDYNQALKNNFDALKIQNEIGDKQGIAISYINIADAYRGKLNNNQAIVYMQKSLQVAEEIEAKDLVMHAFKGLSELNEKSGDYKKAYEYHQLYSQIKDSIFSKESNKQIAEMRTKYETEKKDKEIQLQQLLIQKKDYQIYGLFAGTLFTLIISVLLIQQYRNRTKQRTTELQQKLLRSQMNPHFLFNSLFSIQNFMLEKNADDAAVYLAKFAELMRQILDNSREEYIPLQKEIKTLENYLEMQKLRYENRFDYKIIVDEKIDSEFTAIPPMLAQPFIENAIEHGFSKKSSGGQIDIYFSKQQKNILFVIQDNGIGILEAEQMKRDTVKKHKSLATSITQERLYILNKRKRKKIKFTIEDLAISENGNTSGTKISFLIPSKSI